ncbi:class I SAM-dependent methyltransferase [Sneathiella aquimaris]|uniref:class I SAM-dependent methyltransferase n=1 Tax=Sneathiella aquimaris TaxID=2599305 RepID=UPI00146A75F4|nr:class I SAM-dependent methyltransferase [Sneathiella aquimaris]
MKSESNGKMKHYEELTGGQGKRVFYRAERFRASVVMQDMSVVVDVDDKSFEIFDMSMSGLSFVCPEKAPWDAENESDLPVKLKLGSSEIFQGKGKISRVEAHEGKQKVAVELTKGYLDIQNILDHHDDIALKRRIQSGMQDLSIQVSDAYKTIIADAVYLLRSTRNTLEKVERDIPANAPRRDERIQDIILSCEEEVHARWKKISERGMVELNKMRSDPNAIKAAKRYTENTLTPKLMSGASWWRAYMKPLGYPGDFQVMNYAYNLALLGDTAHDKLCHKLGTSTGEFIATRMTMVKQKLAELASKAQEKGHAEFKVASLGCGPAQEAANFLHGYTLSPSVQFTLIDQDHDALNYAYKNCYPQVSRLDGRASVKCLHATFIEFLAAGNLFKKIEAQDVIYAVGLVDYLTDKRAERMVRDLYQNLKPGGTLMIGSMKDSDKSLEWQVEFVTDWQLEYRTEEEMLAMAKNIPADAKLEVQADKTNHCHILYVTKPE